MVPHQWAYAHHALLSFGRTVKRQSMTEKAEQWWVCCGQCGVPDCARKFRLVGRLHDHVKAVGESLHESHDAELLQDQETQHVDVPSESEASGDDLADEERDPDHEALLDAAARLFAHLFNHVHLGNAAIVRVLDAMQPYVTTLLQGCLKAAGTTSSSSEVANAMLEAHFRDTLPMVRSYRSTRPQTGLGARLRRLGFLEPSAVHKRTAPEAAHCGSVYEVDMVQDTLQLLTEDEDAAADVAASDRRWREMAQSGSGQPRILCDVEDGLLFRERVLPVVQALQPHQLLMVGLPYMDDVDVCNQKGPSAGVHQQNMQYVTWLNLSPSLRTLERNIRLVACCNTSLTHDEGGGFPYVVSDPADKESIGYSFGAQARRFRQGREFDLSQTNGPLSHIREVFAMFLFIMGDNKGLNEVKGFTASFHPTVFSYCRQRFDIRDSGSVANDNAQRSHCQITAKWSALQCPRGSLGTRSLVSRFVAEGRQWLRSPERFRELQRDVQTLCAAGNGAQVTRLLQLLGASHQLSGDGTAMDHGYSGVPGLEEHWDLTAPPDVMHDWIIGWASQQGGAFISLCVLRKWTTVPDVDLATRKYYANLGVHGPSTKLKSCRFTSTWYDPCKNCKDKQHAHVPKRRVCDGESKLPWHAADTLHWMLNSLGIYLLIPGVRAELCKSYSTMDPAVYSYVLLVEIIGRLCVYRFDRTELPQLEAAVQQALKMYVGVPEYVLLITKAKLFFCEHTVLFVLLCGPLRLWWCMRLEGKHQPLKALAVRSNFKNVPYSIVDGAMRTLAYAYSLRRQGRAPLHMQGQQLGHGVGLTQSPVVTAAQVSSMLSAYPDLSVSAGKYYVTHWENASCSRGGGGGGYQRLDTVVMLHQGNSTGPPGHPCTAVYLCMIMGALAVDNANPGNIAPASWSAVSLQILSSPVSVAAHGVWTLPYSVTEVRSRLRSLAGHCILLWLPLGSYHPDADLVPVSLCPSPLRPDGECIVVPRHSGFA